MRASSATDRARETLPPTSPAESATDVADAVCRRCGGATEADRALPPPPLSRGSRPLSGPAASPRPELARLPAAAPGPGGGGDGEADGEEAESKSGLVRVLA